LHTAIETCGNIRWEKLEELLPVTDLVMMDIKHINPDKHKQVTKSSNELILENAHRLAETDKPIIFRTPVIPTVNETDEEIRDIVQFMKRLVELRKNVQNVTDENCNIEFELLTFHRLAADKYRSLGLKYLANDLNPLDKHQMQRLKDIAKTTGLKVRG
jgi:pyruvate formate lyase activating enzyme